MNADDLNLLDSEILSRAAAVVPMLDVHRGARAADVIGLRHDVDDNPGSLDTAVKIARWEHDRGYRATFFMLHTASYWSRPDLGDCLDRIAARGHEIGIHANAIAEAIRTGGDPARILAAAIRRLADLGHPPAGVAPHGDQLCRDASGAVTFVNDEMFTECARPEMGAPDRIVQRLDARLELRPQPLAAFGLEYECYRLPRGRYLSDSGGLWSMPLHEVTDTSAGQLHVLWHPDWWSAAL